MVRSRFRSLTAVGGLVVAGAALAGCGGGSGGGHAAATRTGSTATTVAAPAPTATVPATTVPVTTVPAPVTTVPVTTVPAATVPATTVPSPSPVGSGSSGGGPELIVRSFDGTVGYNGQKPSTIGFSRDSTNIVTHLTWSSWGSAGAVGHGQVGENSCVPNCATGTVTQVPATVTLSNVVGGHFTAMTEKAGSLDRSFTYPSNWAASAS